MELMMIAYLLAPWGLIIGITLVVAGIFELIKEPSIKWVPGMSAILLGGVFVVVGILGLRWRRYVPRSKQYQMAAITLLMAFICVIGCEDRTAALIVSLSSITWGVYIFHRARYG